MKKWFIIVSVGLGLITLGGCTSPQHTASKTAATSTATKRPTTPPLTLTAVNHDQKLRAACIIYYAIKDTKLQRWQELNDFQVGWQVEHFAKKHPTRYLVWPDMNITAAEKNLAPNWFTLSKGRVTYDSMIVHSFHKDQTATTSLTHIIKKLNADHAVKRVRRMPNRLTVVNHH